MTKRLGDENCYDCGRAFKGSKDYRWQAAICKSADSVRRRDGGFRWVSVCRGCYWEKPPKGARCGIRGPLLEGEIR